MANEMQRGNLTGTAIMRMPISGTVSIGGKQMKELRFIPYSEFPETGREETLYIDTDGNTMYYWDGTEYIALSGGGSGGTSNYNELSNKPSINDITLTGNKTSADLGLQPTISDLATIRSGAASGATAVQPSDMETALASKQDVIDDLSDIRTGAAAGETAVQPSALETALSEKQNVISDLADIRSGAAAGATALQPEDIDTLPTDGSSNPVSSGGTYNFVNSSIATNTAYFIGTFASVAELEAYTGTVTNNDYAFVTSTDSAGNTLYNRYKYNAATLVWSFEYAVNNTAFTAAQWAAIQSGMTASDKTKLDGIEQGATKTVIDASPTSGSDNAVSSGGVHTALSGKQDAIADLSDIRSGASAGATAVQPSALTDYQTKLSGTNKLDPSYIDYDASHRAVSDTEKSTWNGKQDAISDLDTIRSGAAAGATALQQSDVSSTYSSSGTAPVNGTAVSDALGTLDVSSVGGFGKYISAISEENGKIEATPITFDTALSSSSTDNNAPTSKTVYDDQQRQETEIGDIANAGAKNLLKVSVADAKVNAGNASFTWTGNIASKNHVNFKINSDLTVDVSSDTGYTASDTTIFYLTDGTGAYPNTILNGCPSGGSGATYEIRTATPVKSDYGSGVEISSDSVTNVVIIIRSSWSGTLTFKPMIRPASITDSTFQPYAKTNRELTVENVSQQSEINYTVNTGVKNLFDVRKATFGDTSKISISVDDTVTSTVTSDPRPWVWENREFEFTLPAGTYIFKYLVVSGTVSGALRFRLMTQTDDQFAVLSNTKDSAAFTLTSDTTLGFMGKPYALSFKLQIQNAKITDPTFQPYALSNPVITPAAIKAVDEGAKNFLTENTKTETGQWTNIPVVLQAGSYVLAIGTLSSTDTDATTCQLGLFNSANQNLLGSYPQLNRGNNIVYSFKITSESSYLRVYSSDTTAHGTGDTVTVTNAMICTAADWAVSQKFVPYAPTNRELYEMIQALQNE